MSAVAERHPKEPSGSVIDVATGLLWMFERSTGVASNARCHLPQLPAGVCSIVSVASTVAPSVVTPSNLYLFLLILRRLGTVRVAATAVVPQAPSCRSTTKPLIGESDDGSHLRLSDVSALLKLAIKST